MTHSILDVSAWAGDWPLDAVAGGSLAAVRDSLAAAGASAALVSAREAVLAPDPMPANRELSADCNRCASPEVALYPVPVINPSLASWQEDVALCNGAKAIRLLPTWHGWSGDPVDVLSAIAAIGATPIVQARVLDERSEPSFLSPARFSATELAGVLGDTQDVRVVVSGLYLAELANLASFDHVAIDLAFVESGDTLASVLDVMPAERVMIGTMVPFLEPMAGVVKVSNAQVSEDVRAAIMAGNARAWFGLG